MAALNVRKNEPAVLLEVVSDRYPRETEYYECFFRSDCCFSSSVVKSQLQSRVLGQHARKRSMRFSDASDADERVGGTPLTQVHTRVPSRQRSSLHL